MMKYFHFLAVFALMSCASGNPGEDGSTSDKAQEGPDLTGHYRVTGPEAETLLTFPLEVSANEQMIWWNPRCAGWELAYRNDGGGVKFYDSYTGEEPRTVCSIGYPRELPDFWKALEGTRQVSVGDDRVVTIGQGEDAFILQPITDPLPANLSGKWRVEMVDGVSTEEMHSIVLEADAGEIWWKPRCAGAVTGYRMEGRSFEAVQLPTQNEPEAATPPPAPVVCTVRPPRYLAKAMTALRAGERVERGPENEIVISGNNHVISLSSQ